MSKTLEARRGFISTAAGLGVFVTAGETLAQARSSVGSTDVLVAMPGDRYYAIPRADLERYSVSGGTFQAEEDRRAGEPAVMSKGISKAGGNGGSTSTSSSGTRSRSVAMGIRG